MMIAALKNIIYSFYPKDIVYKSDTDFYRNTNEYKKLTKTLNSIKKNYSDYTGEVVEIIKKASIFRELYKADLTNLNMLDRCFNFQLIDFDEKKNKQYAICLNLSFLAPFYTIYVLEVDVDFKRRRWVSNPLRNHDLEKSYYRSEIIELKEIAEYLNYNILDEKIVFQKIHDISFQSIEPGDFNVFNAFFLNNYYTKI